VRAEESQVLAAPREDVWELVAEPFHLPDWWPGYTGVQPDRRGLAENARWEVIRGRRPGLMRKPHGKGLIVIHRVTPARELAWQDLAQRLDMGLLLGDEDGQTNATAWVEGSWWRFYTEGAHALPRQALARLHHLCQTASSL